MNKYIGIFLKSAIIFGLFMGLFHSFQRQNVFTGLVVGVISGVVFGLFMAGFSFISDKKLKNKGVNNPTSSVIHQRKLIIDKPAVELFNTFKEAVSTLKKCKIIKQENRSITAKTGFTWKSFGEIITITDKSIDSDETVLEIISKPSVKTTMLDYGKNLENIETLVGFYRKKYGDNLKEYT